MKQAQRVEHRSERKVKRCREVSMKHGMFTAEMYSLRECLRQVQYALLDIQHNARDQCRRACHHVDLLGC
jgi:ribosomal protein S14